MYCPREVVAGLQWARTQQDSTARVPCSAAGSLFTKGPLASVRRYCKPEGTWGDPDFSGCTLVDDPKPSILVWMVLRPFDDRRRRRATGVVDNPELIAEYESEVSFKYYGYANFLPFNILFLYTSFRILWCYFTQQLLLMIILVNAFISPV